MTKKTGLITAASWEPRFLEGFKRLWSQHKFSHVICFWYTEFASRSDAAREEITKITGPTETTFIELPLFTPSEDASTAKKTPAYVTSWKKINHALAHPNFQSFVLDITTMPREALWTTLDLLTELKLNGQIVYHRAKAYGDWCSAEPQAPHIIPKLGGAPSLEYPTKLLIVSGFDEDRSEQFIGSYEPIESLILYQRFEREVNQENEAKNEGRHKSRFGTQSKTVSLRGVDCYSADWGFNEIFTAARKIGAESNLILASLGPKTSAVSLYKVHRNLPESCLVYGPCKNYNRDYSSGIGETLTIDWKSHELIQYAINEI